MVLNVLIAISRLEIYKTKLIKTESYNNNYIFLNYQFHLHQSTKFCVAVAASCILVHQHVFAAAAAEAGRQLAVVDTMKPDRKVSFATHQIENSTAAVVHVVDSCSYDEHVSVLPIDT